MLKNPESPEILIECSPGFPPMHLKNGWYKLMSGDRVLVKPGKVISDQLCIIMKNKHAEITRYDPLIHKGLELMPVIKIMFDLEARPEF